MCNDDYICQYATAYTNLLICLDFECVWNINKRTCVSERPLSSAKTTFFLSLVGLGRSLSSEEPQVSSGLTTRQGRLGTATGIFTSAKRVSV